MAQLVVFPELVHELLFFHVGGELFLLDAGRAAFQIQDLAVAALGLLVGAGALALKLKFRLADVRDLLPDGVSFGAQVFEFFLPLADTAAEVLDAAVESVHCFLPLRAVAGQAFQQQFHLGGVCLGSPLFRLNGRYLALQFALLFHAQIELVAHGGKVRPRPLQLLGRALFILTHALTLLFELFQFVCAGEDTAAVHTAAAGHGAAGTDKLPVQRDDAKAVLVVLRHADRVAQPFGNDGAAQEFVDNAAVFFVALHELGGDAHEAGVPVGSVLHDGSAHGVQRKKCRSAAV